MDSIHRYTITSEGASPGYFRLVEDNKGVWVQYAELTAAILDARQLQLEQDLAVVLEHKTEVFNTLGAKDDPIIDTHIDGRITGYREAVKQIAEALANNVWWDVLTKTQGSKTFVPRKDAEVEPVGSHSVTRPSTLSTARRLAERLACMVTRGCSFNCDAESACRCSQHERYREVQTLIEAAILDGSS